MVQKSFSTTWWGAQWLNALHAVDWNNRLPRGRRYANNGSVRSLQIDGREITARVTGSRPTPYKVSLVIPALPTTATDQLLDRFASDPSLVARLLNRELDPAILDHADALGLAIFPRTWQDLRMACSCPDGATPCKHIAAVIYLISREIDADPFQVFALRGIDLLAAMRRRGVAIGDGTRGKLASLASILPTGGDVDTETANGPETLAECGRINYTALPQLLESLVGTLPADAGFSSATTLRKVWQTQLKRARRRAAATLEALGSDASEPGEATVRAAADDDPSVIVDAKGDFAVDGTDRAGDLHGLLEWLAELGRDHADNPPRVAGWQIVRVAALHLVAAGAVVPRLFAAPRGGVGCLWLPALLDPTVAQVLRAVSARLPAGLVRLRQNHGAEALAPFTQASLACGLVVDHLLREWAELPASKTEDKSVALLFGDGYEYFDAPGENGLPERVNLWLSRLHLVERAHAPVLTLAEGDDGRFALRIAVESHGPGATPQPVPLADVLADDSWRTARAEILQTIAVLAESLPALHDLMRTQAREPVTVTAEELPELLFEVFPVMRMLGIRVLLPKAMERMLRPRASLRVEAKKEPSSGLLNANDLFNFDWRVAVGDALLTAEEFEALVGQAQGVVRFRGEYVYLEPREIDQLRRKLQESPQLSGAELTRAALSEEYNGAALELDDQAREQIRQLTEVDTVTPPRGLNAALRPYQERGLAWLYRNARSGLGAILADDMGLGKTIQVIATILRLKEDGELDRSKALVIVPTTLLTNWQHEIEQFASSLAVGVYHGAARQLDGMEAADILLTTYGTARRDAPRLKRRAWRLLVVDEAQNMKNPSAGQTRAIKTIPAQARIAMSGTPVENRLVEYWSIMDLVNPKYLGTRKHFETAYGKPIQIHGDEQAAERFRRITRPFLMRREKTDKAIISDLPEKIVQDQFVELATEQSALYESVVREGMAVIEGESDTFQRQGLVLQMIMALKQVCNHPGHYTRQGAPAVADSGKAQRFLELVEAAQRQQEKVLVFTQFREMGEMLAHWLGAYLGRTPGFLRGGISRNQRDALVDDFQRDPTNRVLILSLKAGGTGLNLTAASQVIHYDLWWNPAVEDQATDRAYRIGQTRGVQVHRLITRHTFEERINDMIRSKRGIAGMTVASGEQWIGQLGNHELKELFAIQDL